MIIRNPCVMLMTYFSETNETNPTLILSSCIHLTNNIPNDEKLPQFIQCSRHLYMHYEALTLNLLCTFRTPVFLTLLDITIHFIIKYSMMSDCSTVRILYLIYS